MVGLTIRSARSASRRVRLCLAEKGLTFKSRIVDLVKGEHHSPEYLKLNPNGVIPLLILDDGRSLYESGTICEYIDETWPEPPLRPADAFDRAVMRNWVRHVDGLIGNLIVFNWAHGMAQVAQKWTDAELAERLAKVPSKERREAWLRTARKPYTDEERAEARGKLVTGLLDRMDHFRDVVDQACHRVLLPCLPGHCSTCPGRVNRIDVRDLLLTARGRACCWCARC